MRLRLTAGDRRSRRLAPGLCMTPSTRDQGARCPTCGKASVWEGNPVRPFCSVTCKLVDLGEWLDEAYRVPGPPLGDQAREPEPPGDASSARG